VPLTYTGTRRTLLFRTGWFWLALPSVVVNAAWFNAQAAFGGTWRFSWYGSGRELVRATILSCRYPRRARCTACAAHAVRYAAAAATAATLPPPLIRVAARTCCAFITTGVGWRFIAGINSGCFRLCGNNGKRWAGFDAAGGRTWRRARAGSQTGRDDAQQNADVVTAAFVPGDERSDTVPDNGIPTPKTGLLCAVVFPSSRSTRTTTVPTPSRRVAGI